LRSPNSGELIGEIDLLLLEEKLDFLKILYTNRKEDFLDHAQDI